MGIENGQGPSEKTNLQHVLIKWTGSKRRQARRIVERFPRKIVTYHEPFLGGGSVLYELLGSGIEIGRVECSDTCVPLIELWQVVRDDPDGLVRKYAEDWAMLRARGRDHYYEVRHEFNIVNDPYRFYFLLRTCRNGLVRFNRAGEFTSGFHGDRPGMDPETVETILGDWWSRLGTREVRFAVRDFREIASGDGDLLYLDPPYLNEDGKYYSGMIDLPEFFVWLRGQRGDHLLSLNGFLGNTDRTVEVPGDLYDEQILLENGVAPYERLNGEPPTPVSDSLYLKRRSTIHVPEPDSSPAGGPTQLPSRDEFVNRSAEIRVLLEAGPKLTGPEVVRLLAGRGIEVDTNLVRGVRHNLRKAKEEAKAEEERKASAPMTSLANLAMISLKLNLPKLPHAGEVRITIEDLLALARLIGGEVTTQQLAQAGHGLWAARYSQLTGKTASKPKPAGFPPSIAGPGMSNCEDSPSVVNHDHADMGQRDMLQYFSFGEVGDERPDPTDSQDWGGELVDEDENTV